RVAPRLCRMLANEPLQRAVVDTLASLGDEECVPSLVALLNEGGGDVPAVATALERIYTRYQEAYQAGAQIADLVRASIAPSGVAALAAAVPRAGALRALIAVLGWAGA